MKNVCGLEVNKEKVAGVVPDHFPKNAEEIRRYFQRKYYIEIIFLHKYQILEVVKNVKRVIGK